MMSSQPILESKIASSHLTWLDQDGPYRLPDLPYPDFVLEPFISAETMKWHHDKHQRKYVQNLNKLVSPNETMSVERLIHKYPIGDPIFSNSAQIWNHQFFWHCLRSPSIATLSPSNLITLLNREFGSLEIFKKKFSDIAISGLGSGWTWLEKNPDGTLEIKWRPNAETPLHSNGRIPILVCDLWEHAYYIDHRNDRESYLQMFWELVDWSFVWKSYLLEQPTQFEFRATYLK